MELLISAVRYLVSWLLVTCVAIPVAVALLLTLPWRTARLRIHNGVGQVLAGPILRILGVRVTLHGKERLTSGRPAIYVANHTSSLDTVLVPWLGPVGALYFVKREVLWTPVLGQALWLSGHILIDRTQRREAVKGLMAAAEFAKKKKLSLWVMPEGTRSKGRTLGEFKTGFVHLALKTGFPVVPVVITGADKVWPNGSFRLYPGEVSIEILDAIDTRQWGARESRDRALQVQQVFEERLASLRSVSDSSPT